MTKDSLAKRAGRSALWQILGGGWQTLVRLGASFFLARALRPSDFGLFGMALLYQEVIFAMLSFGFGIGIIIKKEVNNEDLSTAFWMISTIRLLMFAIVFLTAPVAGIFWKEPRVIPIIRVVSLTLLFQIIGAVPQLLLNKKLKFAKLNIINGLAVLLESSLAIILVRYTNMTYWALVMGMIANSIFSALALWVSEGFWTPKLVFNKEIFNYLFRFGFFSWLFSIVNYLKQNVDYFIVGRLMGAYNLGLYEYAYRLPHMIFDRISRPVGGVVFPAMSEVQDENEKIFNGLVKAVKFVCLLTYPMLFGLIAVADILVPVFWGDQWLPIIRPLQILCLCAALRCLFQPLGAVFYYKNRPHIPVVVSSVTFALTAIMVWVLGYFYGLLGVSIAMLISVIPSFVELWLACSLLDKGVFLMFRKLSPVIISSLFCASGAYLIKIICSEFSMGTIGVLVFSIISGGIFYLLSIFILFPILGNEILGYVNIIFKN